MRKEDIIKLWEWKDIFLRTKCAKIDINWKLENILQDYRLREIWDFVENRENWAVGIALPQIGILKRWFAIRCEDWRVIVAINPVVEKIWHNMKIWWEACLSEPWVKKQVLRYERILLRFNTIQGNRVMVGLSWFDARLAQHEQDHLDWILLSS